VGSYALQPHLQAVASLVFKFLSVRKEVVVGTERDVAAPLERRNSSIVCATPTVRLAPATNLVRAAHNLLSRQCKTMCRNDTCKPLLEHCVEIVELAVASFTQPKKMNRTASGAVRL
jgi:hypothetical protein